MLARYRYRAYPSPGQQMMQARTFGCARVACNDALRLREQMHAAGEKISDTEVQRRVVTLAKSSPGREWLGEVVSRRWRWSRPAGTPGAPTGTGSAPWPGSGKAPRPGVPGSGRARIAGSRS